MPQHSWCAAGIASSVCLMQCWQIWGNRGMIVYLLISGVDYESSRCDFGVIVILRFCCGTMCMFVAGIWGFCQTFLGLGGWLFCLSSWLCCVVPCGLVAGQGKYSWHLTMCRRNADVRFKSTILCYLFILCFLHKYFQNVVKFFCRSKFEQITPLNDLVIWLFLVHVTVCTRLHCLMLRSSGLGTSHC